MFKRSGIYYIHLPTGKKISLGTKDKKLAEKKARKILTDIEMGRHFPNTRSNSMTIGELTQRCNDEWEPTVGPSARRNHRSRRNCLLRFMSSDTKVCDFRQNEVSKLIAWMHRMGYSGTVINTQHGYVTRCFAKAIYEWRIVPAENQPTKGIKPPPANEGRTRYLDEAETARLWNILDRPEWHWMRDIVAVGLQVGFRKSNLALMQWDWVDLDNRRITIPKGYILKVQRGKEAKPFKMPMSDEVYGVLGRLWQSRYDKFGIMMAGNGTGVSIGRSRISNNQRDLVDIKEDGSSLLGLRKKEGRYVFPIPTKYARTRGHTIWRMFCSDDTRGNQRSVVKLAKIEDFVVHDMKHDFCTKLLLNKVDFSTISKLAAHKNTRQTETYAHVLEESKTEAIKTFEPRKKFVSISSQ